MRPLRRLACVPIAWALLGAPALGNDVAVTYDEIKGGTWEPGSVLRA